MRYIPSFGSLWDHEQHCMEPLIEIKDRGKRIEVFFDLPFVTEREDAKLQITESEISIVARCSRSIKFEHWGFAQKRSEFNYFSKTIALPYKIVPGEAISSFRKGVLKIVIPKVESLTVQSSFNL